LRGVVGKFFKLIFLFRTIMKKSYEKRSVVYKKIHGITSKDFSNFIKIVSPGTSEKILDCMCGYGEVGKSILLEEKNIDLWLLDNSLLQIGRAKQNLKSITPDKFIISSVLETPFQDNFFDKVVIKMGLHEIGKRHQRKFFKELARILKPNGKLIVWNILLTEKNKRLYRRIFNKKDKVAGFDDLVEDRYFLTEKEFSHFACKYFSKIRRAHKGNLVFSTKLRLKSEFKNDEKKLKELNDFIRKVFPEEIRKISGYEDSGLDVRFNVNNDVYVLEK
jgi:ubiquinone/menaquinone biosynthesis C-methylase UbiE